MSTTQGNGTPPPQRRGASKSGRYVVIGFIIAIVLLLLSGILPRLSRQKRVVAEASEVMAAPMVTVAPSGPGRTDGGKIQRRPAVEPDRRLLPNMLAK